MRRSLITATLALGLALGLLGFSVAAEAGSAARNSPELRSGRYTGEDSQGRSVRFFYDGYDVTSFSVGHAHIGNVSVGHGGWQDTCHHGYCFNGHWVSHSQVHGSWRVDSSSHHTGWHASLQHRSGGATH